MFNLKLKRNYLLVGVLSTALLSGGILLFSQLESGNHHQHRAHQTLYYCPMHPDYTAEKPGNCPICNMTLVKMEPLSPVAAKNPSKKLKDVCYLHKCQCSHSKKGTCPMMMIVAKEGEKVSCPICGTHIAEAAETEKKKRERKILFWTDPMIPGYKSDKPGKSPMGMDLIPVYSGEGEIGGEAKEAGESPAGYALIHLSPQKQQLIGMTTAPAEKRRLKKVIRTVGTIAHDPDLYQAEAEYIQALDTLKKARGGGISEIVEQAQRLVEATEIRLRHMGLSETMIQEIAQRAEPEKSLIVHAPGHPVWVYAKIYEYELPDVKVGQVAVIEIPSLPGTTLKGEIRAIDTVVDPATRTTRIRARLLSAPEAVRPDMYINVVIDIDVGEVLTIPGEALFDTGTKSIVFVAKEKGLFEPREVVVGTRTDEFYEIKSGIAPGEHVVTSGNFLIDSESRLKGALQKGKGGGEPHVH
ncbi:MAG: efflux RND transporter periplasmic adaptor subunit [Deltaproteobacteria bacterium]|nr:efflux RND transporter periplasmic adaptor subunit [Deltaproteobacteria bacterium]